MINVQNSIWFSNFFNINLLVYCAVYKVAYINNNFK